MNRENFIKANDKIKKAQYILLVTHDRPDGDGLSSVCALIEVLEGMGKRFVAYSKDEPPAQFSFLPHLDKIKYGKDQFNFFQFDLIITVDCGSLSRTNLSKYIPNKRDSQTIIEFDHHPRIDEFSNIEIRMPEASSTAEVIYYFLESNKIRINKNIANCLLTGILTDTKNFLYPSTSDQTIKIASEMLLYGARFPVIVEGSFRNKSMAAMKLWGKALNNLRVNTKFNFAYSVLTYDDISNCPVADEELEGISGFLSNLHNVNALIFLREEKIGIIRGSLRTSKPDIDVSKLAQILGGGGHKKASGFVAYGHIEKINGGFQII